MIQLTLTTAQVVETSVTVNNNSPIQDYVHPDDQTQPTFEILVLLQSCLYCFYLDHNVFIFFTEFDQGIYFQNTVQALLGDYLGNSINWS